MMSASGKSTIFSFAKNNVGGSDYVPPALCLRPAHSSAYAPAHANATGRARRVLLRQRALLGQGQGNYGVFHA